MLSFISRIIQYFKIRFLIKTNPIKYARSIGVRVGNNCKLGDIDVGTFGSEPYLISLGNHVELTSGVRFINHDGSVWVFRENNPDIDLIKPILIGDNVFIGMNSLILPGVIIGDNVIIGAGSVVVNNVPSNSIAAGVPAKVIKHVDEFYKKNEKLFIFTKNLSKEKKRLFLENKYSI